MSEYPVAGCSIHHFQDGHPLAKDDLLAVEEPLEIALGVESQSDPSFKTLAITMRTPGHDLDLVQGFLFSEGIIKSLKNVVWIRLCPNVDDEPRNRVKVLLSSETRFSWNDLQRHVYISSSCGICGKASIEAVERKLPSLRGNGPRITWDQLSSLPAKLNSQQTVFRHTGGIHAAGIFDTRGNALFLREDVGRHNALDKVIGAAFTQGKVPLSDAVLVLSGRISFELMQKAVMAGIHLIAGIGAPSSLAVEMARKFNITLIGFLRNHRFNLYHGRHRIVSLPTPVGYED